MSGNDMDKLFAYFPHPAEWTCEKWIVWLLIALACAPLGIAIMGICFFRIPRSY